MYCNDALYINGQWTRPASDETLEIVSPHTEAVLGHAPTAAPADMDRAVGGGATALGGRCRGVSIRSYMMSPH
jgi:aldehyde dehydrogenase (NAD+)